MKRFLTVVLTLIMVLALTVPAMAASDVPYVVDDAGLFTDAQAAELEEKLTQVSEELGMDIVVVTTNDTGYKSTMDYADDAFDYGGYGADGVLYLIDMDNRELWISTTGKAMDQISDDSIDSMLDEIFGYVSQEDYFGSAMAFADLCVDYCSFDLVSTLLISLVVGFVIALIVTGIMKGQLNNVQAKAGAADYMKPGSLNITEARDLFLYRHIDRRAKPKDSGSSSHTSSSGRSHGGGGRSF